MAAKAPNRPPTRSKRLWKTYPASRRSQFSPPAITPTTRARLTSISASRRTGGASKISSTRHVGNHDYYTPLAEGYYNYFGAAAGDPTKGYYSFNLGAWHIVMLNSNCAQVGGCDAGSPQERWLKADLAAHPARCTLAVWHEPLFISGDKNADFTRPFWQDLYNAGAEIVVSGHQHQYERFAPQDAKGRLDLSRGLREFVVGTGGAILEPPLTNGIRRNSETIISQEHGVIQFNLYPTGYDWQFIPVNSQAKGDTGQGECY